MKLKKWSSLLFTLILALSIGIAPAQAAGFTNPNVGSVAGAWSKGTDPATINPYNPVILFVHGLNGSASTWYQDNDMYQYAYNNGYQTAFINLHDITGTSQNMWSNGELLAAKIKEISNHFGKKLVIVAHSKGGIDTQTALVHYNAYPYVSNVITLGSPHNGSQLADLAYSSWASWLSTLIGYQNPGTYSMQTSYMQYFRSVTNNHANVGKNKFFTFAGNDYESGSIAQLFGGLFLSNYGDNDGVVTVSSAHLPNGRMVKIGKWNHTSVKTGANMFALIKPYLVLQSAKSSYRFDEVAAGKEQSVQTLAPRREQQNQTFIRGGQFGGAASEAFTVENNVASVTIDWIGNKKLDSLDIIGPDGASQNVSVSSIADDGVLNGAWHHTATIARPAVGEWTASAASNGSSAYLLTISYDTNGKRAAKLNKVRDNKKLKLDVDGLKDEKTTVRYKVDFVNGKNDKSGNYQRKQNQSKRVKQQESLSATDELVIPASEGSGVYTVTAEVEGETDEGFKYRRTIVKSVYIDENGNTYSSS
ncbi:esterase/lipase family protein [Paenibacillus sp. PL91]|uniref:esterase/lipase family protein n=1 Tax=Paenibacillus sp. PL91 TaxID=2729538 RepID=UPI00145F59FC|nr:alpha/beta hydrolase [Paenibacillus sp. PL91]MBC9200554.1 alpha/beta hydrolase [Paenibacillus sp. PL91]